MALSGAMVRKASSASANYTSEADLTWDQEVYDVGGWFPGSGAEFTVPSGVTKVECGLSIRTNLGGVSDWYNVVLYKDNGGGYTPAFDGTSRQLHEGGGTASGNRSFASGPIPCSPGDKFKARMTVESDTSVEITNTRSVFWIKKVDD